MRQRSASVHDVEGVLGVLCARRCHDVLHARRVHVGVKASCVHVCVEGACVESGREAMACAWVSNQLEGEGGLSRART